MSPAALRSSRISASAFESQILTLLGRLGDKKLLDTGVIPWSSPVPAFGDPEESTVATVGINPSNREFVDGRGRELSDRDRRFHTLSSLGLGSWDSADLGHARRIIDTCRAYFSSNPYDTWFRALDKLIQGTGASFYPSHRKACHLDLVPFATSEKWMELGSSQKHTLLESSRDVIPQLLRTSSIRLLVLNGATVVREVANTLRVHLTPHFMPSWSLRHGTKSEVRGIAYVGDVSSLGGVSLGRRIRIIGYNHNIQSSFGVTSIAREEIARWIMRCAEDNL